MLMKAFVSCVYAKTRGLGLYFCLCLLVACKQEGSEQHQRFVFLGHAYDWYTEDKVDPRLELIDYSAYDGVWLGGDVCARTTKNKQTLGYLDSLFELKAAHNHWAIGNHDIMEGDVALIEQATQRPSYYSYIDGSLAVLVLNTNLFWHYEWDPPAEHCKEKEQQLAFIQQFCDTLQGVKHLVVLHHHGIFNEFKRTADSLHAPDNMNAIPLRVDCRADGDLTKEWYPHLVRLVQKDIAVTCIGGDVGMSSKKYSYRTADGITLLGSGINNTVNRNYVPDYVKVLRPDTVLLLNYQQKTGTLDWDFVRLNELLEAAKVDSTDKRMLQLLSDDY